MRNPDIRLFPGGGTPPVGGELWFNGVQMSNIYFNGVLMTEVWFNGVKIIG